MNSNEAIIRTMGGVYKIPNGWLCAEIHNIEAQYLMGQMIRPAESFVLVRYDYTLYTGLDVKIPVIKYDEAKAIINLLCPENEKGKV